MGDTDITIKFEPEILKAYNKNEAEMKINIGNKGNALLWCECEIKVVSPLSLMHDRELNEARTRIGIIKPGSNMEKRVKIYTRPNNFPEEYKVHITTFAYGEDGAIVERNETDGSIQCVENGKNEGGGDNK
jgi:uncharacterized membrane protein